ncbi:MAG: hypothetical protein U0X93_16285 [Anaerolineales bacterium]
MNFNVHAPEEIGVLHDNETCVLADMIEQIARIGVEFSIASSPTSCKSMPCVYVRITARYCGCTVR